VKVTDKRKVDPDTGEVRAADDVVETDESVAQVSVEDGVADHAASSVEDNAEDNAEAVVDPVAELTDTLQRVQAEYANYRKRVDRDREQARDLIKAGVLSELLPVLDDIGRARSHGELEGGFKSVGEALESLVIRLGMVPFGQAGEVFDPLRHEAIAHEESDEAQQQTCASVFQLGYEFAGRVIRPAIVSVVGPTRTAGE
jgi:molecular chaperone GrpE